MIYIFNLFSFSGEFISGYLLSSHSSFFSSRGMCFSHINSMAFLCEGLAWVSGFCQIHGQFQILSESVVCLGFLLSGIYQIQAAYDEYGILVYWVTIEIARKRMGHYCISFRF
ncbi:hypothetical protein SAY87_028608 [Trapa incisa]|uniref:Uncharacterized protein n=1 Tax=Trapa incisa TaxID=236973 RepID=A0AAN7KWI9_9MYRT|nr:hypothetical protein SAY87_028608 [Trapa incisa]